MDSSTTQGMRLRALGASKQSLGDCLYVLLEGVYSSFLWEGVRLSGSLESLLQCLGELCLSGLFLVGIRP